jgi:hypothetical protein
MHVSVVHLIKYHNRYSTTRNIINLFHLRKVYGNYNNNFYGIETE